MLLSYSRSSAYSSISDHETAATIGAALVQSKLNYCNSLFLNLPGCEIDRLQFVQNSLARAICRRSKYTHVTPILKSLHWLKVKEQVVYITIYLSYMLLLFPVIVICFNL